MGNPTAGPGFAGRHLPRPWNLSHSDIVQQVPLQYIEAGSQIVLTNTFRANRISLASYNLADRVAAINREGVRISLRPREDGPTYLPRSARPARC